MYTVKSNLNDKTIRFKEDTFYNEEKVFIEGINTKGNIEARKIHSNGVKSQLREYDKGKIIESLNSGKAEIIN